jgi:AhpD family alkylhydroperoxidase
MPNHKLPIHYANVQQRFPEMMKALEALGTAARQQGPLDHKTTHLIQLAAAAALQSEGAVHSHVQRAVEAGATRDEIYHTVVLLVSTIGFPRTAAAISWIDDMLRRQQGKPARRSLAGSDRKPRTQR